MIKYNINLTEIQHVSGYAWSIRMYFRDNFWGKRGGGTTVRRNHARVGQLLLSERIQLAQLFVIKSIGKFWAGWQIKH